MATTTQTRTEPAGAAKKAATKKATATRKPAAKKAAAKKAATKQTTATRKPAAKKVSTKAPAKKATTGASQPSTTAATSRTPLRDRPPRAILEGTGYAITAVLGDVVDLAKDLPSRAENAWEDVNRVAKEAPERARSLRTDAPAKLGSRLSELRDRLATDTDDLLATLERYLDTKAADGREVAERLRQDERVATLLDRTNVSRAQVKAAVTSATKTADVAVEAGRKQIDLARSQAKGAVTIASKTPEAAREASREQADNARTHAKAAVTSVRRTADEVTETL